jgi:RimJ/RimL family protein N-acetyltransferase
MTDFKTIPLKDELVSLVPLVETDFERLYQVAADPDIWDQHPAKDRYKREVFRIFFDNAVASHTAYLIFERQHGQLIGSTRFYDYDPEQSQIAIGYTFIARNYWGKAYNKAAKTLMIEYAFKFADNILLHIGERNLRSQKAIAKLGAQKVREFDFDLDGRKLLHYEYLLTKND